MRATPHNECGLSLRQSQRDHEGLQDEDRGTSAAMAGDLCDIEEIGAGSRRVGWGKQEFARAELVARQARAADRGCGSRGGKMLRQQSRVAPLSADVDEPECARRDDREAERGSQDLPAAFPMRTIDDERARYRLVPDWRERELQCFRPFIPKLLSLLIRSMKSTRLGRRRS
jgi:hypothetical protein